MQISRVNSNVSFGAMPANRAMRRIMKAKHNLAQKLVDADMIKSVPTVQKDGKLVVFAYKDGELFTGKTKVDNAILRYKNGVIASASEYDRLAGKATRCQRFMPSGYIHEKVSLNGATENSYHLPGVKTWL